MKKLLFSLLAVSLMMASCSTEDVASETTDSNSKMLESFTVKRNTDGSYTLITNVSDGTGTMYFDDAIQNEVHLIADGASNRNSLTHNYDVMDNQLNLAYVSEEEGQQPTIRIIDDNTVSTSRDADFGLLNTYSIVSNEDGTIQLNFEVKSGVDVAFGYNNTESVNDVYLTEDVDATQLSYSKSYNKETDGSLRIDFVQANNTSRDTDTKKPRIIMDTDL